MTYQPQYGYLEGWQAFDAQIETIVISADYNWQFSTVNERTQKFRKLYEAFQSLLKKRNYKYRQGPTSSSSVTFQDVSKTSDRKQVFSIDKIIFTLDPVDASVVTVSMTGFTIPTDNETRYFTELRTKIDEYAASLQGRSLSR
jgi:hypothetical protein